jgi:alpha-L-rhamnosidase
MLRASQLQCEYLKNPLGLCCKRPRFSWILESDRTNVMQTGVRIQVSEDERFEKIHWDSGGRSSEESVYTQYDGPELIGRCQYYWRVRLTDSTGDASGWSETSWFEMAPDAADLRARWIAPDDSPVDARVKLLRKSFLITEPVKHARLYASSLGQLVCAAPRSAIMCPHTAARAITRRTCGCTAATRANRVQNVALPSSAP